MCIKECSGSQIYDPDSDSCAINCSKESFVN